MTSKIVVNNIEADAGISTVTFNNEVTAPTFNGNIVGTAATFSGNVDIAGALTYEDVTNVDSVGVVTARSGIHVTGGSVGIGQTNPQGDLHIGNINGSKNLIMHSANQGNARIRFREGGSIASGFNEYSIGMVGLNNALTVEGQGAGEIIRIMGDTGRIGIGTDNPEDLLHLESGNSGAGSLTQAQLVLESSGSFNWIHFKNKSNQNAGFAWSDPDSTEVAKIYYDHNTDNLEIAADDDTIFKTNATEKLRITSDGNLFVAGTGGMNTTQLPNGSTISINGNSSSDGFGVIRYSTGYGAYGLNIARSKSGTVGTNAAVTDGNDLGHITFYGADGSSYLKASMITAQVDGDPAGSGMPGRLVFKTSPDGSATPVERLRISQDGRIGVGGIDPQSLFDVKASGSIGMSGTVTGKTGQSKRFMRKYGSSATHDFAVINGASPYGQSRLSGFVVTYTFRSMYGFDSSGGGHGVRMLSGRVRDSGEWDIDGETNYGTGDSPRPTLSAVDNNNGTCTLRVTNPSSTHSFGEFNLVTWDCQITSPNT